jgi:primosomal protein N'
MVVGAAGLELATSCSQSRRSSQLSYAPILEKNLLDPSYREPARQSTLTLMQSLVLLNTRSAGISGGLTYETGDLAVQPGDLVNATLRNKPIEGLVIATDEQGEEPEFALKPIREKLSTTPLLSDAQIKTMRWMAGYYRCSLRAVAGAFLPSTSWKHFVPKETESQATSYKLAPISIDATLTSEQQSALEIIQQSDKPTLLFGITGSGKTEIYAALIRETLNTGKQAILLVPEILLTEHTIGRFEQLMGRDRIAIVHSRLKVSERKKLWKRIRSGEADLVIGSRSALFSPCPDLGLIIIDEEHEWTYKNEQTPRYHARETAETLCRYSGAKLVLGSATPSLESWHRVKTGAYGIARLPERYAGNKLPDVRVIDLANVKAGNLYPFSPPLLEAINDRLQKKEQSVLFLNRRGAASSVLCLQCRRRLTSPVSQLPFTLHRDMQGKPYLLDHIGGATAQMPAVCPSCKAPKLLPVGAGTQKLEDILRTAFPDARILRADSDTLKTPEEMRELLSAMRERRADILLGTQSVVKGLDLPGVTLAAVPVADVGLSLPHFRAGERVFQMLTQLTGRSGRTQPGEVIIQTFRPDAPEIVAAASHRTEDWLNAELTLREQLHYPPATQMVRFILRHPNAEARARVLHKQLQQMITDEKLGGRVTVAQTLHDIRTWHVLYNGNDMRQLLQKTGNVDAVIDVDPIDVL